MADHLKLRGSIYYVQKRVPDDVRTAVGSKMLERSLRTGVKAKAQQAKLAVLLEWQDWFASIRAGGDATIRTPAELHRYAVRLRQEVEAGSLRQFDAEETIASIVDNMADSATDHDAQQIVRARQALRGHLGPTLGDEVGKFLQERGRDLRQQTVDDLRRRLGDFTRWAGESLEVTAVDRKLAGRYVAEVVQARPVSPSTRVKEVSALRTFYGHLLVRGVVESNPFDKITGSVKKSKRGQQAARRAWTEHELLALVTGLDQSHPVWALAVIGIYTGMRREEIGLLRGTDFNAALGTLQVAEGKTDAAVRLVPVHPVIAPLLSLLAARCGCGYLLADLSPGGPDSKRTWHVGKKFLRDRRRLGLNDPRADFHALRKTFISAALNAGAALPVVQQVVGHEQDGVTLSSYTEFTLATCRAAVEAVSFGPVDEYVKERFRVA